LKTALKKRSKVDWRNGSSGTALPIKHEALCSNLSTQKEKKKETKLEVQHHLISRHDKVY
jgi:hypothetical protein